MIHDMEIVALEAVSSILDIVDQYLTSKVKETVGVAVRLQSNKLKEEVEAENQELFNQVDSTMKAIIKEQDAEISRGTNSKESKTSGSSKGTETQHQSSGKSTQVEEPVFETAKTKMQCDQGNELGYSDDQADDKTAPRNDWYKKPKKPPTPDHPWNKRKAIDSRPPQTWISNIAKTRKPPRKFDELLSTPIDFSAYVMNNLKIDNQTQEILQAPLIEDQGRQVVPADYFINNDLEYLKGRSKTTKYTNSTTRTKAVRDDNVLYKFKEGDFPRLNLRDIEDMLLLLVQKKLSNLDVDDRYDVGIIYQDKYKRNMLMRSDELYKFCDATLSSLRSALNDIASNLEMDYLPKRYWSNMEMKRSCIMVKAIDKLLFERRLMCNLEKFVSGRDDEN
nr:hypothetical protein [Tanacetum cinerariifolium]